ncbi:MAG: esterase/lipase family protein [Rhodospirillales bacterium]
MNDGPDAAPPPPPRFSTWPPRGSSVSAVTLMREFAALARASMSPPPFPRGAARGTGQPVIVVPGFCAPDLSTARLRDFLNRQGFAAQTWDCGTNFGPTPAVMAGLDRQITALSAQMGCPVALVGISLGGTIAREVAKRHPACIDRVVTLVSPIRLPVVSPLSPLAEAAARLWDNEATAALDRIAEPPPVPLTAIVNPNDGVVDWRDCMPAPHPGVTVVMVAGAHMSIASNPDALRAVAAALAQPA